MIVNRRIAITLLFYCLLGIIIASAGDTEVALLLPYHYGNARPRNDGPFPNETEYCVIFKPGYINRACKDKSAIVELQPTAGRVCIECQPTARHFRKNRCVGDGGNASSTSDFYTSFWSLINARHCNGYWTRTDFEANACKCAERFKGIPHYLFV